MIGIIGNHSATKEERAAKFNLPRRKHAENMHKLSNYNGCIVPRTLGGVKKARRPKDRSRCARRLRRISSYRYSLNHSYANFLAMHKDIYKEIVELCSKGISAPKATIIARKGATPRKDAAKMLIYADGRQLGSIGGGSIEAEVRQAALPIMETGKAQILTFDLKAVDSEKSALVCGGSMEVYVEAILPDPTLFIFGGGHVGKAVAKVAK